MAMVVTAGLVLLVLALLAFRLMDDGSGDPAGDNRRERSGGGGGTPTALPTEAVEIAVPDVRGQEVQDAIVTLLAEDLAPTVAGGLETGIVVGMEPPPGSEVVPGTTVTLVVPEEEEPAEEDPEEEPEEDDEPIDDEGEEEGPPAHSEGKAKGKEKKDK